MLPEKSIIRNQNLELQKNIYIDLLVHWLRCTSWCELQTITFCSMLWWSQGLSCFQESKNLCSLSFSYCFFRSLVSSWVTFLFNGFPGMASVLYCKKAMTTVFWSDKMFRINNDCYWRKLLENNIFPKYHDHCSHTKYFTTSKFYDNNCRK